MPEWMSKGQEPTDGEVRCRRCNRVADRFETAVNCGWENIGFKIAMPHDHIAHYWGRCRACVEKAACAA